MSTTDGAMETGCCPWALMNQEMRRYHDTEWGVPVHEDGKHFEHLMMEVMQCGLSWNTVLQKREVFRQCLAGFDWNRLAAFTGEDVARAMETPGMIRATRKIQAIIDNARCFQKVREEFGSFSEYLCAFTEGRTPGGEHPRQQRPVRSRQPGPEGARLQVPWGSDGLLAPPVLRGGQRPHRGLPAATPAHLNRRRRPSAPGGRGGRRTR